MSMPGAPRNYEQTLSLDTDREALWKALSDAGEITKWFAMDARVERDDDGSPASIWLSWGPAYEGTTKIETWEPGNHLRTYDEREVDGQPVKIAVDYFIEGDEGELKLRIVHSGFTEDESWDNEFDAISSGWKIFTQNLKHYLERQHGKPAFNDWTPVPTREGMKPSEAWDALIGPGNKLEIGGDDVGASFTLTTEDQTFTGELDLYYPKRVLGGRVNELDDGLFRFTFGELFKAVELNLHAFGIEEARFQGAHASLLAMLEDEIG